MALTVVEDPVNRWRSLTFGLRIASGLRNATVDPASFVADPSSLFLADGAAYPKLLTSSNSTERAIQGDSSVNR